MTSRALNVRAEIQHMKPCKIKNKRYILWITHRGEILYRIRIPKLQGQCMMRTFKNINIELWINKKNKVKQ